MESWGGKTTPTAALIDMASTNLIRNAMYAGKNAGEEAAKLQRYSIRKQLVTDVVSAASAHALRSGLDVHEFEDLASSGISIVNGVQYALTEHPNFDWSEDAKHVLNWNFWEHIDNPVPLIKKQKFPYMSRDNIESEAYAYLELPYRVPSLERLLVDVLIALELFAFTKEMFEKPLPGLGWASRSPLMQKHAVRKYIIGQFWSIVILLGIAWLAGTAGRNLFGDTFADWTVFILVGLFFLDFVFSTVMLPFAWRAQRKEKKNAWKLIKQMLETYHELRGEGQQSARRLREVAARAADAGVVWPKPLFLILDDNERRLGRI